MAAPSYAKATFPFVFCISVCLFVIVPNAPPPGVKRIPSLVCVRAHAKRKVEMKSLQHQLCEHPALKDFVPKWADKTNRMPHVLFLHARCFPRHFNAQKWFNASFVFCTYVT